MTEQRFAGKHVLLTGASSGIGRASAVRFVAEGAKVFGLARSAEGLEETKSLVADPERFSYLSADMGEEDSVKAGVAAAVDFLDKRIDVISNISGLTERTPIDAYDSDLARKIFEVNYHGPMRLIAEALPYVVDGGTSSIINIASNSGTQGMPELSAYGASKAALITASFGLAIELAPRRIRCVPISPSGVQTDMMWRIWEQVKDYEGDWFNRLIHLWGQMESGTADELAAFILFAASPDAVYWNGSELRIDGGARATY